MLQAALNPPPAAGSAGLERRGRTFRAGDKVMQLRNDYDKAVFNGDIASGGGIWRTNNSGTTWVIGHSGMGSNARFYNLVE